MALLSARSREHRIHVSMFTVLEAENMRREGKEEELTLILWHIFLWTAYSSRQGRSLAANHDSDDDELK